MRMIVISTGAIGGIIGGAGCLVGDLSQTGQDKIRRTAIFSSSVGLAIADDFKELSLQENLFLLCEIDPAIGMANLGRARQCRELTYKLFR